MVELIKKYSTEEFSSKIFFKYSKVLGNIKSSSPKNHANFPLAKLIDLRALTANLNFFYFY